MDNSFLMLTIVLLPLLGALALPLAGYLSTRLRNLLALGLVLAPLAIVCAILPASMKEGSRFVSWHIPFGFNAAFHMDCLAFFMAAAVLSVGAVIVLYSFGYISHYGNQNEYYFLVVFFLGSMMGIVFSANLILLYFFWEMTAIVSWRLIGFFRNQDYILRADKAFLVTVGGAVLMLLGFVCVYQQTGSFDLAVIQEVLKTKPLSGLAVVLIMAGIFSKSAILPFHTWLPDAGVAPSPVTALLHAAVLVKIGVYVYARLFVATFSLPQGWSTAVAAVACTSAIVSALAALVESDLKRIIAYSTVSQIGFIFFGLATGGEFGLAGALLYILMHGLAKAGLFLCAGIVEQNTKTKDIDSLGGLIHTMPVTACAFLCCAFSVMGIPPFGGFFSKYMVFMGAVKQGQPVITAAFLCGAFLTVMYLLRVYAKVFLGEARIKAKEGSAVMVASVALLALFSLAGGILVQYPLQCIQAALQQILRIV